MQFHLIFLPSSAQAKTPASLFSNFLDQKPFFGLNIFDLSHLKSHFDGIILNIRQQLKFYLCIF